MPKAEQDIFEAEPAAEGLSKTFVLLRWTLRKDGKKRIQIRVCVLLTDIFSQKQTFRRKTLPFHYWY